jgi:hypothetical protein
MQNNKHESVATVLLKTAPALAEAERVKGVCFCNDKS